MSRLFDLVVSLNENKPDIMTNILEELEKEIEFDNSIYNSNTTGNLDYWYSL